MHKEMDEYKNPIPSVDDEDASRKYCLVFTFLEPVTKDEAAQGINNIIKEHGKIPAEWIKMGEPKCLKYALPQSK